MFMMMYLMIWTSIVPLMTPPHTEIVNVYGSLPIVKYVVTDVTTFSLGLETSVCSLAVTYTAMPVPSVLTVGYWGISY